MSESVTPIVSSTVLLDEHTVSVHQLVQRSVDDHPPEEWIVTAINSSEENSLIVLSDPEFNFRLPVEEDVFLEKGFIPVVSNDGSPVWAY